MPGASFFIALAVAAAVVASAAGIVGSLTPGATGTERRSRTADVVRSSLQVAFLGFGVIAVHELTDDVDQTVRIASVFGVLMLVYALAALERGAVDERFRRQMTGVTLIVVVFIGVNVGLASVGYLELILLVMLARPALLFAGLVDPAALEDSPVVAGDGERSGSGRPRT